MPYRLLPDPGDTVFVPGILQRGEELPLQQAAVKGEKGYKLNVFYDTVYFAGKIHKKNVDLHSVKTRLW